MSNLANTRRGGEAAVRPPSGPAFHRTSAMARAVPWCGITKCAGTNPNQGLISWNDKVARIRSLNLIKPQLPSPFWARISTCPDFQISRESCSFWTAPCTYQLETFVREPIGVEILSNQLLPLSPNAAKLLNRSEGNLAWDRNSSDPFSSARKRERSAARPQTASQGRVRRDRCSGQTTVVQNIEPVEEPRYPRMRRFFFLGQSGGDHSSNEREPSSRSVLNLLTRNEAWRIVANIANCLSNRAL
jgi:hypothetical protein